MLAASDKVPPGRDDTSAATGPGSCDRILFNGKRIVSPAAKGAGGRADEGCAPAAGAGGGCAAAEGAAGGEPAGFENKFFKKPNMKQFRRILPGSGAFGR